MKTLSAKTLKRSTKSLYKYGTKLNYSGSETTTGNDPTNTTVTVLTTISNIFKNNGQNLL